MAHSRKKAWVAPFLEALRLVPNVVRACDSANVPRRTVYDHRQRDDAFRAEWDDAIDEGIERLENEMHRRAFEGTDKPVYQGGQKVGHIREYSDTLAIFLAKAHRPEKYRERQSIDHSGVRVPVPVHVHIGNDVEEPRGASNPKDE